MAARPKVYVSRYFPGDGLDLLKQHAEIIQHADTVAPMAEDFEAGLAQADAAILYGDSLTEDRIAKAPKLKIVADQQGGRGVDKEALKGRGIVLSVPSLGYDWIIPSEAEHAMALLLSVTRRIPEANAFVKSGKWVQGEQSVRDLMGNGLNGKTVGIVNGSRRAGADLVRRLQGWNVKILHADATPNEEMQKAGAEYVPLDRLVAEADFIVLLHGDFTRAEPYIGAREIALMKPTAYFVSITVGKAADEKALAEALRQKRLAGIGLDKLQTLGKPGADLIDQPNAILTPHADGSLEVERSALFRQMVEDVIAVLGGGKANHAVS
ncbi:MAG TPA: NAD(P)-dependent oxidoreductase [Devosiaceae bacterium]|jgi:phosphoglycerate dehydrogenase-like enzyme